MAGSSRHSFLRTISVVAAAGVALLGSAPGAVAAEPPGVAAAAAAPLAPEAVPPTVTADALPTWQVNGVVWSQAIVGTTAYVTGSFTKARPPGVAAGGAGEVTAGNILAIDITTGNRVASFNHSLNAQGLVIRASADGTKLFVGGDFTAVDGQTRGHIASFDLPSGALNSFAPNINGQVRGLGITSTTVYAGGNFTSAAGASRTRLAAFQRANGSLTPWAPSATGGYVWSMVMSPDQTKVIAGGSFTTVNGQEAYGMASINADATTNPWPATANAQGRIRAAGANGAITSLKTDGTNVFGTSYAFGAGASFEGPFSINPNSGEIVWANDCLGDTYDITVMGSVAYNVSHQHDCSPIGSFPDTNPRVRWQKASATTAYPTGITERNDAYGWNFIGVPYAQVLHWFPNFAFGSITASGQAGWAVDGTADGRYLLVGGEFPRVNGVAQQGLVRFARSDIAPRKVGPSYATIPATPVPATTAVSLEAGTARVTWGTAWDYDDSTLTYELLRDNAVWVPQATRTIASNFWTLPRAGFVDTGLAVGSTHRYQVRITDSAGNQLWSPISNTVTIGAGAPSAYAAQVKQDGAAHLWRLGEPSGTSVMDWADFDDATLSGGYTRGASGATADGDSSTTFDGINGLAVNSVRIEGPQTFTVEAWFRTTTSSGGKIVGFGDQPTGNSSNYDRHIYMEPDGRVTFGVWNNGGYTVSSPGALNDGQWHHAVGTMEPGTGVTLYVDGKRIGRNPTSQAQPYSGYWRIGGDSPWSGNAYFAGDIDEVAVYPTVLTLDQVRSHWTASGRAVTWPTRPTDAYGAAVWDSGPDVYWRLGEAAGPAAVDSSPNGANGQYQGSGHTFGQPGVLSGNTAVRFDGAEGTQVVSATQTANPNPYSEELWFSTTTTVGGKLIGFGCSQTGRSNCYDRHVWMNNDGTLHFGAWTGSMNIASTTESFNDGQWHHLVATQGTDGMKLYVDGILRGTNPQQAAEGYSGWWRLGGDNSWGGSSAYFNGVLDEAAIYPRVLTPAEIADHFAKGGGLMPNQAPSASFSATTSPLTVAVDGSASSDPDGTIASYTWDFGDGTTGTGSAATHTYAAAGTYTVTLTVTDNRNATASTTRSVTIAANLAPLASFTTTTSPLTVAVDGSASTDPDGTIASYTWDFGDGTTGTGTTATHTYASAGTFTVTLTVTDDLSATASSTQSVTIA
ncbi:MAG TPA: PKD domain-containing protein, partial [Dermatophilaceae bacterium]|nr:PKD domain-containing protein [Dermatophilaceae bacterium]